MNPVPKTDLSKDIESSTKSVATRDGPKKRGSCFSAYAKNFWIIKKKPIGPLK